MSIGKRLTEIRKAFKLTQLETAKMLNIKNSALSRYENGTINPSFEFFNNISNVFNVNLNWLITGNGQMLNNRAIDEVEKANNITERLIINQEKLVDTNAQLVESNSQLVNMNIDYYKLIKELISTKEKK